MKLTPYNRRYRLRYLSARSSEAPKGVDIQTLIHRNEPNRPHISSVFINVKELHQKAKKQDRGANSLALPPHHILQMPQSLLSVSTVFPIRPEPRNPPPCRVAAAGEGGSKHNSNHPQYLNYKNHTFFENQEIITQKQHPKPNTKNSNRK